MRSKHRPLTALLFGMCVCLPAWSAETLVAPGAGTLSTAISAAAPGDTLVLENGTYSGDVLIDKALTLRGINSQATAMITGSTFVIDAANGKVVIQGVDLAMTVDVNAAADIKILENTFYNGADIDLADYKTSEGDGGLMVIGNHLLPGGEIQAINTQDAYIAGNTIDSGRIWGYTPMWIVGNQVIGAANQHPIYVETVGSVQAIGNRVRLNGAANYTGFLYGIYVGTSTSLIASNIVEMSAAFRSYYRRGIYSPSTTFARVFNNTVNEFGSVEYNNQSDGIWAAGEVSGNIVTNLRSGANAIRGSGIDQNLCFNNGNNTCGSNAVTTDPKYVDSTDYKLAADSPGIDAGPDNPFHADIDRTRNDMGAYGGPWGIAQYDAQRDPFYLGPFVYPLFDANASFVDGQLQVRALGVARLR